jgi:ABC-type methionine transport system ATPase subunit
LGQKDYDAKLSVISKLAIKEESEGKFKPEVDEVDTRTA